MKLSRKAKQAVSAAKYFLFCAILAGITIYGVCTGEAPGPTRSRSSSVSRAIHPAWFWTTEAFLLFCTAALAWGGVDELRKGQNAVAPPTGTREGTQIPPAAPGGHAAPVAKTAGSPPQMPAAAQPPKPATGVSGAELRSTSPDGRYIVRVYPEEMRMSLWVETPELFDTATRQTLFRPPDSAWSLGAVAWQSESVVTMTLRRYPGAHTPIEATFDCAGGTARIGGIAVDDFAKSARVEQALEQAYAISKANYRPVRH